LLDVAATGDGIKVKRLGDLLTDVLRQSLKLSQCRGMQMTVFMP
jgi:hypothetical protein